MGVQFKYIRKRKKNSKKDTINSHNINPKKKVIIIHKIYLYVFKRKGQIHPEIIFGADKKSTYKIHLINTGDCLINEVNQASVSKKSPSQYYVLINSQPLDWLGARVMHLSRPIRRTRFKRGFLHKDRRRSIKLQSNLSKTGNKTNGLVTRGKEP